MVLDCRQLEALLLPQPLIDRLFSSAEPDHSADRASDRAGPEIVVVIEEALVGKGLEHGINSFFACAWHVDLVLNT
eukprot:CAMPEP_0114156228 /NCGR_PEP_ID=MMETSP0043_2-20121206/25934_1 /TAXON_ID=464988 /ORGANISM="Hemiselmis andersenii, Strain CCMP644" /LENGTH=75 /DNA_ID=CAMNT_0001251631 /DNA_START=47 /DNA_END=270 /DNA_ORIENTATION=-